MKTLASSTVRILLAVLALGALTIAQRTPETPGEIARAVADGRARADEIVEPEPLTIERAEEAAFARKALDMLTERDREALLMREEGLDYTEIAGALELSVTSVGTTLARARRRLVEAYESLQHGSIARGSHAAS